MKRISLLSTLCTAILLAGCGSTTVQPTVPAAPVAGDQVAMTAQAEADRSVMAVRKNRKDDHGYGYGYGGKDSYDRGYKKGDKFKKQTFVKGSGVLEAKVPFNKDQMDALDMNGPGADAKVKFNINIESDPKSPWMFAVPAKGFAEFKFLDTVNVLGYAKTKPQIKFVPNTIAFLTEEEHKNGQSPAVTSALDSLELIDLEDVEIAVVDGVLVDGKLTKGGAILLVVDFEDYKKKDFVALVGIGQVPTISFTAFLGEVEKGFVDVKVPKMYEIPVL